MEIDKILKAWAGARSQDEESILFLSIKPQENEILLFAWIKPREGEERAPESQEEGNEDDDEQEPEEYVPPSRYPGSPNFVDPREWGRALAPSLRHIEQPEETQGEEQEFNPYKPRATREPEFPIGREQNSSLQEIIKGR